MTYKKWDKKDMAKIRRLRLEEKLSFVAIGERFGVSPGSASAVFVRAQELANEKS